MISRKSWKEHIELQYVCIQCQKHHLIHYRIIQSKYQSHVLVAQLEEIPAIIVEADTEKKIELELTYELDAYIDTFSKPENTRITGSSSSSQHGHDRLMKALD